MCIQGKGLFCELSSDEIIADKGNMRSVILGRELTYIYCMLGSRVRGSPCLD
jgi:hypothetical protein